MGCDGASRLNDDDHEPNCVHSAKRIRTVYGARFWATCSLRAVRLNVALLSRRSRQRERLHATGVSICHKYQWSHTKRFVLSVAHMTRSTYSWWITEFESWWLTVSALSGRSEVVEIGAHRRHKKQQTNKPSVHLFVCLSPKCKKRVSCVAYTIRWAHLYIHKYYTVTLKSRLSVTQGHWKQNHGIDHIRLSSSRVIWHWILLWPWNVG